MATAAMDPAEREMLLCVMESVSADRDWREAAGDDPCSSPWPGLECRPETTPGANNGGAARMHVARLDFKVPPNPTCKDTTTFPVAVFALPELRALFLIGSFKNPDAVAAFALPPASNLSSSRLQQLSVRANPSLSGTLPPQLSSLRSLQVLAAHRVAERAGPGRRSVGHRRAHGPRAPRPQLQAYNSLTGPITSVLGDLRGLVDLDLSYNSFSDLSSNNLTGGVPSALTRVRALSNNGSWLSRSWRSATKGCATSGFPNRHRRIWGARTKSFFDKRIGIFKWLLLTDFAMS
ncbi:unnamed protein product [Miscanthus lutarioriparius]|uniref:Uncharacterized protein n=1 Tax=Miscanthus lutarioriparius TaxID=422564 RepID=A0A811QUI2_9POAL|nr:unnamed protein product [Miscanthus lutarioriparius]